jgi:4-hydroxy-tetrahydrodipicolinate synthase
VAPRLCAEFQAACAAGDFAKARDYQDRLMPLHDALFCETSPAPVKYAVSLLGRGSEEVRLPLAEASEAARAQVRHAMQGAGIIN